MLTALSTRTRREVRANHRGPRRRRPLILVATFALVALSGWALFDGDAGPASTVRVLDTGASTPTGAPATGAPTILPSALAQVPTNSAPAGAPPGAAAKLKIPASAFATAPGSSRTKTVAPSTPSLPALPFVLGAHLSWGSWLHDVRHDQGVSVPLPDGRSMWIFADTTQITPPFFFVTSSAAVSARGSEILHYAGNGKRLPIEFLPRTAAERAAHAAGSYTAIWPTGATTLPGGRIIISYAKYEVSLAPKAYVFLSAGLFEYHYHGVSALTHSSGAKRIADGIWTPSDGVIGSPIYADGYVYFAQCANLECFSLRTTPGSITDRSSYTWWTGHGWSKQRSQRTPMSYGASRPGLSPSMAYLPQMGVYATTGTAAGQSSQIGLLWVAPHPWGPWSSPAAFLLPQCPSAGCYTLNLHPLESTSDRVRISYATAGIGPYVYVTDVALWAAANGSKVTRR